MARHKKNHRKIVAQKVKSTVQAVHKQINIPNLLTIGRIWAIPMVVLTFFFDGFWAAWLGVILFALAGITDYMDGYLARHMNQLSRFGRIIGWFYSDYVGVESKIVRYYGYSCSNYFMS